MAFNVGQFAEKLKDDDPDIRHMALYDLNTELKKDTFSLDEQQQKVVTDSVLRMLDDHSSEVQGVATRCLPLLVKKVKEKEVEKLVVALSTTCLSGKKEKRDVAGIAMKTVALEIPTEFSASVKKLTNMLVGGLDKAEDEVKLELLDVINDVLKRFGAAVGEEHAKLQQVLLRELQSTKTAIRKKAIVCLASLCVFTSDALFQEVLGAMLSGIEASSDNEALRKYIQICSAISRTAGQRLGRALHRVVPVLVTHIGQLPRDEGDEVRENIIQAFESFVQRCPQQCTPFLGDIVGVCKQYLSWDPIIDETYEQEDMEEDEDGEQDDEDDMDQDEGEDDDVSWKVRKACAKCLSAIIQVRPDMLEHLYQTLCSKENKLLPKRFRDRVESVKLDVFKVFLDLLQASKLIVNCREEDASVTVSGSFSFRVDAKPEVRHLVDVKEEVLGNLRHCLKEKSIKVKVGCFSILRELTLIIGAHLSNDVPLLVSAVCSALKDKNANSTLKTEVLSFLRPLLRIVPADKFGDHVQTLSGPIFACVNDKYYKIIAEGVRVCGEFVRVVVKSPDRSQQLTQQLFECVFARLAASDIDQDVKEAAIFTAGRILHVGRGKLAPEDLRRSEQQLLVLLRSEMSRLPTIKTLSAIKEVDLDPSVLNAYLEELSGFLRKANRPLRQASLTTLRDLVQKKHQLVQPGLYTRVVDETTQLISDQDLHLTYLALELVTAVLSHAAALPQVVAKVQEVVLPKVLLLLKSALLQGHALSSVITLFDKLAPVVTVGFDGLLTEVLRATVDLQQGYNKQVYNNAAQVVAVLCVHATEEQTRATLQRFVNNLQAKEEPVVILGLYCLGEMGRQGGGLPSPYHHEGGEGGSNLLLFNAIKHHFESTNEEVKTVASVALGRLAVGALQEYLPRVLQDIQNQPSLRYLLLRSLKEIVSVADGNVQAPLKARVGDILPLLFQYAESDEEGVRNVVAECIGKLALLSPQAVLPLLRQHTNPADAGVLKRATIVTALKYTITEHPQPIDQLLREQLKGFLVAAFDKGGENKLATVKIRRAAILLFTAAAHNKPDLVRSDLGSYMPALYGETPLDKDLIREVNLGPFKHKVDDGLELRKAAFECLDILLDNTGSTSLLEFLNDYPTFLRHVLHGLVDENQDIVMLSHLMLGKLCKIQNATVPLLAALPDTITKELGATVTKKLKANAVQQEQDRHRDLVRSGLRCVESLKQLHGSLEAAPAFAELYGRTIPNDKELKEALDRIRKENEQQE
eukprot:TRINITY_DN577_c0_g1_i1.p2 TRINITY_DN577_c0_g1~~TRINITY_DN577_c0_g1_i1.p2  ORF type:complete len:1259 (+),score=388.11 TRINITY_DN577_c0_g1_i1:1133-4909(+)